MMSLNGLHEVAIAAEKKSDCKIMCAAMVNTMVKSYVTRHSRHVRMSMRARGSELLYDEADLQAAMRASDTEAQFALQTAIDQPNLLPDTMELSVRTDDQYCGRLRMTCTNKQLPADEHLDAVLLVIAGTKTDVLEKTLPDLLSNRETAVVVAVQCDSPPAPDARPEAHPCLQKPFLASLLDGRPCVYGWYSPYGFTTDGNRREAGSAAPYGIAELFWELTQFAAGARLSYLQSLVQASSRIIQRRVSIFQQDSVRRVMELDWAREQYARAVCDCFSAKQLLALTVGSPLAGDAKQSVAVQKE